jgi:hypothetical protein
MRWNNDLLVQATEQEKIRRGSHEWKPIAGSDNGGVYVERPYVYQEYPKMLGTWPKPELKQFLKVNGVEVPGQFAHERYEAAVKEWDEKMRQSIVTSAAAEAEWRRKNK